MKPFQKKLIEFLIDKKIVEFGEFKLKSGRNSFYFFNSGLFNTGRDLELLGHFYAEALIDSKINFDLLFGPAYKGIPIVITTTIILAKYYQLNIPYCFNRKEKKDYGEGGHLIGSPLKGRVIILDDVITAGTSIHESMKIIRSNGATLAGVIIFLDRQEDGYNKISSTQEVENKYGCRVISIIKFNDLIKYLKKKNQD